MECFFTEDVFRGGSCVTELDYLIRASIHKLFKGNIVKAYDWLGESNPLFFGASPHEVVSYLGKGDLVLTKINEFLGEGNEIKDVEEYWKSVQKD